MAILPTLLESKMKIRFHDCDPFNHLNNSRYIDYFVTARGDQLAEAYGLDIYRLAGEKGKAWVTGQTQVSYLSPALLMEEVTIQTQLLSYGERTLLLEALMWNVDKTVLKAVMWMRFVHFDLATQKSLQHSPDLMQLFEQVTAPLPFPMGFEERVSSIVKAKP